MSRSKSSKQWLKEHFDDQYVKMSQEDGVRSRAVYKLQELDQKDKLIRPGINVVDLGAAPGGWSEYVAKKLSGKGAIIATDILPMDYLPDVKFIQGDFREESVLNDILEQLENNQVDLVLSDIAPNISGIEDVDQANFVQIFESILDVCSDFLDIKGILVMKFFNGSSYDFVLKRLKSVFREVKIYKPDSSRTRSNEMFFICIDFKDCYD